MGFLDEDQKMEFYFILQMNRYSRFIENKLLAIFSKDGFIEAKK
jgi:hypothetical protein